MFEMAAKDAIHLGLGEPDFDPPAHVRAAAAAAMDTGQNRYGSIYGLPELRAAIAEYLNQYRPGRDYTEKNVIVTMGGSEALMVAAQTFYDRGDEILIPDPGFVFYRPHAMLAGATPVPYPLVHANGFLPDIEDLKRRITPKTRVICVNSPSNPTGAVFPQETVKAIADLARDHHLLIVTDEVYDRIVYDKPHISFLAHADDVLLVHSFSKMLAIPGWRTGFLSAPVEYIEKLSFVHYYTVACPSTPLQRGVLAGLTGPQDFLRTMVNEFRRRRDLIVRLLNDIPGFDCLVPEGAFYVFPKFDFDMADTELALRILKAGVVCGPGAAFGTAGAGHLRFSYAASLEKIEKGMAIVRSAVAGLPRRGRS